MRYKFGDIAINSTLKKKPEDSDKFHYIGLEHLDSGSLSIQRYGAEVAPIGEKLVMQKGDVLFGKRRAYQKKVAIAPFDGIFSAHGMVLRPKETIVNKDYFPFFISSDRFLSEAIRISVGSLSPTINWRDLRELEFDLPPIEEQERLAELLWAAYDLKESYKKLIAATDEMVESQFIEMFGNESYLTELGRCIDIIRGVSYKPTDVSLQKNDDNVAILRANNISNGSININDLVFADEKRVSAEQRIRIGDIIVCASNGSKELVGKAAINTALSGEYAHGAFCLLVRCRKDILLPPFLNVYFQTHLYRTQIDKLSCGTNILNIKPGHLNGMKIFVPNLVDQSKFIAIAEQADKSKAKLRKSIESIDKVMKSLLP